MFYANFPPLVSGYRMIMILFFLLTFSSLAQQDFNQYKTLTAQGSVPADFTMETASKIEQSVLTKPAGMSSTQARVFYESIHVSIDELLQSGSVLYGDEITQYIQAVAANLLKDDKELLEKLRFYTIKSNETNALSTDQGIIFVTTGLISQLSSEAQLAYVLSHEIAHFTEKHIKETYTWKAGHSHTHRSIRELNQYSRENELEADQRGIKLYHAAGYSKDEIISTFDVLMYSYLPFDEVKVPNSYFQTEKMYIPESFFSTKEYPIKVDEDYNDVRSSHPNIKKRKDAAREGISDYTNWGDHMYSQGEQTFLYIRNCARFESIRTDIIDGDFAEALYTIFLLEREFPESVYLKHMKALSWLGLAQFREKNKQNEAIPGASDFEGESASMYYFLKKLNADATLSLAIRAIRDLSKGLENDSMMLAINDRLAKTAAKAEYFSWSNYSASGFHESAQRSLAKNDSLKAVVPETGEQPKSKYDKIKTKKNTEIPESFDSTRFYFYGLSDILSDSVFRTRYMHYKTRVIPSSETVQLIPDRKAHFFPPANPMELTNCILVEPGATFQKKGKYYWKESYKSKVAMKQGFLGAAEEVGIQTTVVDQNSLATGGSNAFNDRCILYSLLEQTANSENTDFFPVDYERLQQLGKTYGTSNILFSAAEYTNQTNISTLVLKTDGGIQSAVVYSYIGTPTKQRCLNHYKELLEQLKQQPR